MGLTQEVVALTVVAGELGLLIGLGIAGIVALHKQQPGRATPQLVDKSSRVNSDAESNPADDEFFHVALAQEILDYCDEESDAFAQDECRTRARRLIAEHGDEASGFVALQREDGEVQ